MKPLTPAQKDALYAFASPGGAQYGDYTGIGVRTVEILAERGLVLLGALRRHGVRVGGRLDCGSTRVPYALATEAGIREAGLSTDFEASLRLAAAQGWRAR